MLLGDSYGLLKINVENYKILISDFTHQKRLDTVLEAKILNFYVDNYVDFSYICKFFSTYGKYIVEDFKLSNSNKLIQEAAKDWDAQLQLKNKKYLTFKDEF